MCKTNIGFDIFLEVFFKKNQNKIGCECYGQIFRINMGFTIKAPITFILNDLYHRTNVIGHASRNY